MIKKDLIEEVIHKTGLDKTMVKEVVDSFLEVLTKNLSENRRVELRRFGVFETRRINAKKARNPRTGQEVIVPKKDKIIFKPSKIFKKEAVVNTNSHSK